MASRLLIVLLLACSTSALFAKSKHVILGEQAFSRGSYDSAVKHFKDAIAAGDETGEPRFYIGLIFDNKRKYAESIPWFAAAADRKMNRKYKKAALWKLVIYYQKVRDYGNALRYASRLEDMGEKSSSFNRLRDEAGSYSGPGSDPEANALLKRARELEESVAEEKRDQKHYAEHKDTYLKIIDLYRKVAARDPNYTSFLWKSALYLEKLGERDKAEEIYRTLYAEKNEAKSAYKLGVLLKRKADYAQSLVYLARALELNEEDDMLRYYTRTNAAQSNYALRKFDRSGKHAADALEMRKNFEKKPNGLQALQLTYCLSVISEKLSQANTEIVFPERYNKICKKYESKPEYESEFAQKLSMLYRVKSLWQKQNRKAAAAVIANEILKFSSTSINTENDEEEGGQLPLTGFTRSDAGLLAEMLYRTSRHTELYYFTVKFDKDLQSEKSYDIWRGVSSFALGKFEEAVVFLEKIENRSVSHQLLLHSSFAKLKEWDKYKLECIKYVEKNESNREKILTQLKTSQLFDEFRTRPDYAGFLTQLSGPAKP